MLGLSFSAALFAAATPAIEAQTGPHAYVAGPVIVETLRYGPAERQSLELFTRAKAGRAPLVVYLHGGGWSAGTPRAGSGARQPDFYTSRGFAYATIAYRFIPTVTVEQQLDDVARAIALLRSQPNVDGQRIVLVGHSSGGHMAALLATDPNYLAQAGVPFASLRGVVLLDAAAIDLAPVMAAGGGVVNKYFRPAFGDDPARWSRLSPLKHTESPNAPAWAILSDANNPLAGQHGAELAAGLIAAGAREAGAHALSGTTHVRLNDAIGAPGDAATDIVVAFLERIAPQSLRPRLR